MGRTGSVWSPRCSFFGVLYFRLRLVGCIYFLCLFFWLFCYAPRAWLCLLYVNNGYTYQIALPGTMFGWGENREDGKQRKENRVENSIFHCLAKEGKQGGRKTQEKVFSSGPTIFILPNREENVGEKSALTALLHKCPLFPTVTATQQRRRRQFSNHQLSTTQLS